MMMTRIVAEVTALQVHGPLHDSDAVDDGDDDGDDDDGIKIYNDYDDDDESCSAEVTALQVHGPLHGKL